jgi:nucleolar protein 4
VGGTVEEVVHPAPADAVARAGLARDGCAGGVAFITYASVKEAMAAVAKLHGATVEGEAGAAPPPLSKKAKKKAGREGAPAQPTGLGPATVLWARQVSGEGALLKKWRLIIRNLAFSVDEAALRGLLAPAGFVWELNILRRPDGTPRGFAFAGFTCRAHAAKAIALANAVVLGGRPIAVDWAVGKAAFSAAAAGGAATGGEAGKQEGAEQVGQSAGKSDGDDDSDGEGGPTFTRDDDDADDDAGAEVDIAAEQRLLKGVVEELDGGGGGEGEAKGKRAAKDAAATAAAEEEAATAAKAARAAAATAEREARVRAAAASLAASGAGVDATVFVRGLPAEATPGALRTRLEAFGDVKACRLVMDKKTGRPKGTAFVEYATEAGAAAAAAAAGRAAAGNGPPVCVGGAPKIGRAHV